MLPSALMARGTHTGNFFGVEATGKVVAYITTHIYSELV